MLRVSKASKIPAMETLFVLLLRTELSNAELLRVASDQDP